MANDYEVIIRLDAETETLHICSCWPKYTRRFTKKYGKPYAVTKRSIQPFEKETSSSWALPLKAFRFPSVRKSASGARGTRSLSEGQKKAMQAGRRAQKAVLASKHHK